MHTYVCVVYKYVAPHFSSHAHALMHTFRHAHVNWSYLQDLFFFNWITISYKGVAPPFILDAQGCIPHTLIFDAQVCMHLHVMERASPHLILEHFFVNSKM
jgi:hypothetical protein